ncbi:MAG: efflux transporter outer membrane subunit, partial [Deltaproteobacteria bacterium]|nr:efflux transporter outer membrane subunit [Deltaproteobacteria bacterium]
WQDLDQLVEKGLAQNLTLHETWARLQQSQAQVLKSRASQYPNLSYSGDASHDRRGQQVGNDTQIITQPSFGLSLATSYEVDLWGRVAAEVSSDRLTAEASRADWMTAQVTIASQIADTWIQLITQHHLVPLAHERWQRSQQQLELLQLRYRQGIVTGVAVAEQQRRVAEYRAELLPLEEREQQLHYDLALLLGELPSWRWQPVQNQLPKLPEITSIGLPADLLAQRPDVRAAGLRLQSADWSVSAARADRLPALRLSASAKTDSAHVADLFDSWLANLAASVTGPVFDGHRRAAEVERTKAVVAERLASYKKAVLTAMSEVETALMQERKRSNELIAVSEQVAQQLVVCEQQRQRYLQGDDSYLSLLGSEQAVTLLKQQQLRQQRDLLLARTALHRALGGRVITPYKKSVAFKENSEG